MDNTINYIFNWDCIITTRRYYNFMNNYKSFKELYRDNEEYKKINNKYVSKILSITTSNDDDRSALDKIAINTLDTNIKIITYMDILNQPILAYIVELFFGIHRFFALQDMFRVLHNKKIKITIISKGVYKQINNLLKILLYSCDDILKNIDIILYNENYEFSYLCPYDSLYMTKLPKNKSDIIINMITEGKKIFYVDDNKVEHDKLISGGHLQNTQYHFYDTLKKDVVGLTLNDMQIICNFNFPLSGGHKSNYIKLKKYLQ
jgi:hypothetical protein